MRSFGPAWLALAVTLGLHVTDEAVTDFLSVYNPIVTAARARLGWFPMPTFSFPVWLGGLVALVVALFALTPFAYRGARWLRPVAYFFAAIMFLNGLGHLGASVYVRRWMPGSTTAPLLLASSSWLFAQLRASLPPGQSPA